MQTALLTHAGSDTGPSNSATRYTPFAAGALTSSWSATSTDNETPIAEAGELSSFRVYFPVAITTGQYAVTLRRGASGGATSDTAITGTITSGNTLTLSGTLSVAAGDRLSWKIVPSSTPEAQTNIQIACLFTATTSGKSVIFANCTTGTVGRFMQPGAYSAGTGTDADTRVVIPTGGDISKIYVRLSAAPGVGNSKTFTLNKNGTGTALTVTIADTATEGNASATAIAFSQGDEMNIEVTVSGTPTTSLHGVGLDWTPTISGEAVNFGNWTSAQSTTLDRYNNINGRVTTGSGTDAQHANIIPVAVVFKKLYAKTDVAPGAGNSRTITLRKGGVSQSLSAQINDAETTQADNSNEVSLAAGDLVNWINTPASGPASNVVTQVGVVSYIAPAGGGGATHRNFTLMGVG